MTGNEWHMPIFGLLRENAMTNWPERYNRALTESFTHAPEAEKALAASPTESNGQPFLRYGHAG